MKKARLQAAAYSVQKMEGIALGPQRRNAKKLNIVSTRLNIAVAVVPASITPMITPKAMPRKEYANPKAMAEGSPVIIFPLLSCRPKNPPNAQTNPIPNATIVTTGLTNSGNLSAMARGRIGKVPLKTAVVI